MTSARASFTCYFFSWPTPPLIVALLCAKHLRSEGI